MICHSLYGINREAVFVILKDALQRLSVLHHLSPQYARDNKAMVNGVLKKEFTLPRISTKVLSNFVDHKEKANEHVSFGVTPIIPEEPKYGECGRFEREMCQILDTIELARAEISGVKAIQLPNGRIQYISDQQLQERKSLEDLDTVSGCLGQLLKEIDKHGTFEILTDYVLEKIEANEKIEIIAVSDKVSEAKIHRKRNEIESFQEQQRITMRELESTISHLKHQKQELVQKNQMESNLMKIQKNSDIEQMKLQFQAIENEINDEIANVKSLTEREIRVNIELSMYLRNSLQELEQNVDYWMNVYSVETNKFQVIIKNRTKEFETLKHELVTLSMNYVKYEKVCVVDREIKAKQAKLDEIIALHNSKALIIQKWWRFICVMLSIGPQAPKKKGKKKDKKK